jgi:hypothetical protein
MVTSKDLALADIYNIEAGLVVALQGKPHRDIAKAIGIGENLYYKLRSTNDLFKQIVDRARAEGHEVIAESVLTIVEDNPDLLPQSLKIKLEAITTYLKWMNPTVYGDRMIIREEKIDLSGALKDAATRVINITPIDPLS